MKRRVFLKLAIGALMFPQLPTSTLNTTYSVKGWTQHYFDGQCDGVVTFDHALKDKEIKNLLRYGFREIRWYPEEGRLVEDGT